MRVALTCLLTIFFGLGLQAQKSYYVDSVGNLYWQKDKPVYLFVSDSPDGAEPHRLKSERTPKYADPFYLDTEGINFVRTRDAVDPETKKIIPNTEVMYEIYADGTNPSSQAKFGYEPPHKFEDKFFFTSGVKIGISSRDNLSGVRNVLYSINNSKPQPYTDSLQFDATGRYIVRYFAVDNVGNTEEPKVVKLSIDPLPPSSSIKAEKIYGDSVASESSTFFIQAKDSLSGISKVYYKIDDGEFNLYNRKALPTARLSGGEHTITYYAIDNVGNKEEEQSYSFYLDKSPPLMVADILGDRFIIDDQVYFSGRTKLKLTAVDNKVGVREIKYSVDGSEFQTYTKPFYLPSVSGVHSIKYYSVDNLGNSSSGSRTSRILGQPQGTNGMDEFKHNVSKIYVDLTGPIIDYDIDGLSFVRGDTLFIGPYTNISLDGEDDESKLREITYSINDELGEIKYEGPFTFDRGGFNTINFYGYDNVNNRNVDKITFYCDIDTPEIFVQFNTGAMGTRGDTPIYPKNTGIFLSATDEIAGVSKLRYILDKNPERNYSGLISGIDKGKHTIKVFATDMLNNTSEKEVEFIIK